MAYVGGSVTVNVKTLTGREVSIDNLELSSKIEEVKIKIEQKEGIPPSQQRLIFSGKQVEDNKSLEEAGVNSGDTLHLVLALRGGANRYMI